MLGEFLLKTVRLLFALLLATAGRDDIGAPDRELLNLSIMKGLNL